MRQLRKHQGAFTLIELLVVVIIVAILAGVGIPLLTGNLQRARLSEADAGLGTLRTGLRAYFAENSTYVGATLANIGISATDLNGRFFETDDYSLDTLAATTFCVQVTGDTAGAAVRGIDVNGVSRSMDQNGTITDGVCP